VKIYVGAVEALREKERQDFMDNSNPEEKASRSSLKMYSEMSNLASLQQDSPDWWVIPLFCFSAVFVCES
jgi:hypothetical protein